MRITPRVCTSVLSFCCVQISIKEFLALVDESIKERNGCQFLKGLNNKTKLTIYKSFEVKLSLNVILMGWVMQELVYSLSYILERKNLK